MARPAASIIVTADSWAAAQPCVDRLQPKLGVRDELIVTIADEFFSQSTRKGSVRVVTGAPDSVIKDAVMTAQHDYVVFMDPALIPTGHWLDALFAKAKTMSLPKEYYASLGGFASVCRCSISVGVRSPTT